MSSLEYNGLHHQQCGISYYTISTLYLHFAIHVPWIVGSGPRTEPIWLHVFSENVLSLIFLKKSKCMIMLYIVKFMSSWSGVHALGRGQYYHFAKCPKLQFFPVL